MVRVGGVACGLVLRSFPGVAPIPESGTIPQNGCGFDAHSPQSVWKPMVRLVIRMFQLR